MKARLVVFALAVLLLATGCAVQVTAPSARGEQPSTVTTTTQSARDNLLDSRGNFVLYVGNTSSEIDPVDIAIEVDGTMVLKQEFAIDWYQIPSLPRQFTLRLAPGKHTLVARSVKGEASMETSFVVTGKHWAVVDYRYHSEAYGSPPQPRSLSFLIRDEPVGFD